MGTRLLDGTDEVWPGCPDTDRSKLSLDPAQSHPTLHTAGPVVDAVGQCVGGVAGALGKHSVTYFGMAQRLLNHYSAPGQLAPFDFHADASMVDYILSDSSDPVIHPRMATSQHGVSEFSDDHKFYAGNGCDVADYTGKTPPRVFMWGWDWRQGGDANAAALKDFIDGCVSKFWPNRRIDIIAHSQGGLVTRRYIVTFPNDNKINHVATIGTPFLGAPKGIYVLATGKIVPSALVSPDVIKNLAQFFPGPMELVPANPYLDLLSRTSGCDPTVGCSPYVPFGVPAVPFSTYESELGIDLINYPATTMRPINPATIAEAFYGTPGQADWRTDQSGIKYLHIVGLQQGLHTPAQTTFGEVVMPGSTGGLIFSDAYTFQTGPGDGTVPIMSSSRVGGTFGGVVVGNAVLPAQPPGPSADNLNASPPSSVGAPGATLFPVTPDMWQADPTTQDLWYAAIYGTGNNVVEHTNMTGNGLVTQTIFDFFDHDVTPTWPTTRSETLTVQLDLFGIRSLLVTDETGTSVDAITAAQWEISGNLFDDADVAALPGGGYRLTMSGAHTFTISFQGENQPATVISRNLFLAGTTQVIAYRDFTLSNNGTGRLSITSQGPSQLALDLDGDGVFETTASPTATVTGQQAYDHTPPVIQVSRDPIVANTYTITATDSVSVADILYSIDGAPPTRITGNTVTLCLASTPSSIGVAADDEASNRSGMTAVPANLPFSYQPTQALTVLPRAGWVATSSTASSSDPASNALDGNAATRFATGSGQTTGQWFSVDMGMPQTFSEVTLDPAGSTSDYARAYQVFVSNDAVTWSQIASGSGSAGVLSVIFPTQTARFIGVVQTGTASNWWSIAEFNVYGPGAFPSIPLNLAQFVASASATGGTDTPAKAIDGLSSTRWTTGVAQANGQSFTLDMGQQQAVTGLKMDSGSYTSDFARGYQIFVSNDGVSWGTAVASGTGTSSPIAASFAAVTGRYLRIVQTGSASNWWSIVELQVYGVGSFVPVASALARNGWTASASSSCGSDVPSNALDDNSSTRWSTGLNQATGQYFVVDMGAVMSFTSLALDAGTSSGDYPRGYAVFASLDGSSWGNAIANGTGSAALVTVNFARQNARFIKIVLTQSTSTNWWSIHEFNVYGSAPAILIKDGWTATASVNSSLAQSAIDGKLSTRWDTGVSQTNGQSFQFDMLSAQAFDQITLNADGNSSDYPRAFQVFASNDPNNWGAPIATGVGSASLVSIGLPLTTARYVKIVQTGSASNWWSINELNVWAPATSACRTQ
jgi:hypothetical protein